MTRPLQGLTRKNLPREVLAGITLIAIAVPLNIGYAQIAGLPATSGLYALVVPTLVYVFLVSSRQVVASPDAAAAALVFSSLVGLGVAPEDMVMMAGAQAIVCGIVLAAASFFRLGFLANFLSQPILVGFVAGLAVEVLLSQVRKMLGIARGEADGFFSELWELITRLPSLSVVSTLLSVIAVVLLVVGRRFVPMVPGALIVLIAATAVTAAWSLQDAGLDVLGAVEAGPPQFAFPMLSIEQWLSLVPSALALALVTMAEGVLVSKSYGQQRGYTVNPDRDLLAFGAANVASGLSMSFSVGSSTSRTAAMDQSGSRTQLPSVILAAGTLLLLLFGTDLLAQIPSPVIGAIVAVAVIKLLGVAEMRELARLSRYEFIIAVVCLLGVLTLGPLKGLFLAFLLSLINLARRAASPDIDVLTVGADIDAPRAHGEPAVTRAQRCVVIRFAGPVFFANGSTFADRVMEIAREAGDGLEVVIFDAEGISDVDVTGAEAFRRVQQDLRDGGLAIAFARLRPALRERFERFGLMEGAAEFHTNRQAVAAYESNHSTKDHQ